MEEIEGTPETTVEDLAPAQTTEHNDTSPALPADYTASKSEASMETSPEDQTFPLEIFAILVGAVILAFIFLKYFRR